MSGFTPGPWTVSYADNPKHGSSWGGYWQIDAQYDAVACNQYCYAGVNKPDVSEANARLIAAAPEMLEALQKLRNVLFDGILNSDGADVQDALKSMSAAIAKATPPSTHSREERG